MDFVFYQDRFYDILMNEATELICSQR